MSDTWEALCDALQAHIQANEDEPAIVTDFVIAAATAGTRGDETGYSYMSSNSPPHHLTGLTHALAARHEWPTQDWEDDE